MIPISRRGFLIAVGSAPALQQRRQTTTNRPSSAADLPNLQISEASLLLKSKRLSPLELTTAVLRRIDEVEPKLHAFVTLVREEAMRDAAASEKEIMRGAYRGPLHGIPFGVKDTHYTKGIRTTAGSPVLADFIPTFDATVVAKLKAAGAILIGKTTLPEFSFGGATPGTNNPWDVSRTPGGSSGGPPRRWPLVRYSVRLGATLRVQSEPPPRFAASSDSSQPTDA